MSKSIQPPSVDEDGQDVLVTVAYADLLLVEVYYAVDPPAVEFNVLCGFEPTA